MKFAVALVVTLGACSPLPHGEPIDASAAYEALGSTDRPPVFSVAPDCRGPEGLPGFFLDGDCRGGLSDRDTGIYIVVVPGSKWSDHFAHELVGHWAAPDLDPGHHGAAFQPGGAVSVARLALFMSGRDEIQPSE